jgi:hypothetical protein
MDSRVLLAGVTVLALTASAQATTYSETFVLTGAQQVPPVNTSGFGAANVNVGVDTATHTLTWNIIYTGLSSALTGAEFRGPAQSGATGPIAVNIGSLSGLTSNPLAGSTTISNSQVQQIINGQWYVSLDTQENPGGELRGQLPAMSSAPVPEPAALSLLGLATVALSYRLVRRR